MALLDNLNELMRAPWFFVALSSIALVLLVSAFWHRRTHANMVHAGAVYADEPGRRKLLWQGTFPTRKQAMTAARNHAERFDSLGDVYSENPVRVSVSTIKIDLSPTHISRRRSSARLFFKE